MREIPEGLAAHLQQGATTLCRCWSLTRRDGAVLGFTDHDRALAFDEIDFAATTGLEAAESASEIGFAIGVRRGRRRFRRDRTERAGSGAWAL
jgi:hypothetical protein